ncbi:hypothetical protein [Maribacter dokdonensis]|uniref:hypothetical protein n=1 Tax=Maribacter dokdonensis TaxID=320912 RepID=UPI002AB031B8|nr:hypothetical protein [Maribacter dokdonensis]
MKGSRIKHSITRILLVLYLFTNVSGLHVLSHSNDEQEHDTCIICDHAIINNFTPTISPSSSDFGIENPEFIIPLEIVTNYRFTIDSTIVTKALFSRPPPVLL